MQKRSFVKVYNNKNLTENFLQFNGDNSKVTIPHDSDISGLTSMSIVAWVYCLDFEDFIYNVGGFV